jgi:chromosome segregation ATPase
MATNDLDWPVQLKTCQIIIAELEEKIASQMQKIQRLLDQRKNVKWAQCLLAMRQESLERAQNRRNLIESRIADCVANRHHLRESNAIALNPINADAAAKPQ